MRNTLWNLFYDLSTLPVLCLILSCSMLWRHRKRLPQPVKPLVLFLFFNLFIEVAARVASVIWGQNLPLLHVYTFGECLLLSLFYRNILDAGSVFRRYFWWIVGSVLVLVVLNTIFLQHIMGFNSYAKTLVQILIILYALDYAFRFSEQEYPEVQLSRSLRLINSAILVYYSGSLFVFMSSQFELSTKGALRILWNINTVLNLLFQIVVLIALWKVVTHPRKLSSSSAQAS